MQEAKSQKLGH